MLVATLAVWVVLGAVFMVSTSADYGQKVFSDSFYFVRRHLLGLAIAGILLGLVWKYWSRISAVRHNHWVFVAALSLLALPLLPGIGYEMRGASRWINVGFTHVYAYPLSVPLWIFSVSAYLAKTEDDRALLSRRSLVLGLICLSILVLLGLQPNIGAAAILLMLILVLCALAGKIRFAMLATSVLLGLFMLQLLASPYRMSRLWAYWAPFSDRLNSGYQLSKSLTAFGGGDAFGTGLGAGIVKDSLPGAIDSYALAVVAEETGAFGVLALLFLALVAFICAVQIAGRLRLSQQRFESLLVMGLSLWMAVLTIVNVASVTGWLPHWSVPFPLLSYGNAYLIALLVSMAVVLKLGIEQSNLHGRIGFLAQLNGHRLLSAAIVGLFIAIFGNVLAKTLGDPFLDRQYALHASYVVNNSQFSEEKSRNRRGRITDRFGRVLAKSIKQYEIWVDPRKFDTESVHVAELSALLEVRKTDLLKRIDTAKRQGRSFTYLKRTVDLDVGDSALALGISGLHATPKEGRYYPSGEAAAQVLGIVDVDGVGQSGIEYRYNDILNSDGSASIKLSIDRQIQVTAFEELAKAAEAIGARRASVIVVETQSGEVLAMASFPRFDPNNRNRYGVENLTNNAGHFQFEPAALLTPFTLISALMSGELSEQTLINTAPGFLVFGEHTLRDPVNYGHLSPGQVLLNYSKVGLAKMAAMGPKSEFWSILDKLGFGRAAPVELDHLPSGYLRHAADWTPVDQAALGYGYGLMVTPLQLARAFTVLANDGRDVGLTLLRKEGGTAEAVVLLDGDMVAAVRRMLSSRPLTVERGLTAELPTASELSTSIQRVGATGYIDRFLGASVLLIPEKAPEVLVFVLISEARTGEVRAEVAAKSAANSIAEHSLSVVRDY